MSLTGHYASRVRPLPDRIAHAREPRRSCGAGRHRDPSAVRVSLRLVDDLDAIEKKLDVARELDDSIARARLIPLALALPAAEPFRAEYLDELAYAYEQLGRFDEAVDAMRDALDAGWDGELDDHPSARALIADLLLRAGRAWEAERAWREAELERPRDPRVHRAAGNAYANVGPDEQAFQWRTRSLELGGTLATAAIAISEQASNR
jgi:tetratricopeptide (TPR) repeat protein